MENVRRRDVARLAIERANGSRATVRASEQRSIDEREPYEGAVYRI
jgi:hypothetical protein